MNDCVHKPGSSKAEAFLGKIVSVVIDRPLGSKHPEYGDIHYFVNYGFVPGTKVSDGEELDAYVLGVFEPLTEFTGKCIAVIRRLDDDDDKLVLASERENYTDDQIRALTGFVEKYFRSVIVRKEHE